jgi:hypothetical protein
LYINEAPIVLAQSAANTYGGALHHALMGKAGRIAAAKSIFGRFFFILGALLSIIVLTQQKGHKRKGETQKPSGRASPVFRELNFNGKHQQYF